jgi:predicted Rossmann fold flavoprotein
MRKESIREVLDLGIIGGGAAGLFAACFAKRRDISFLVLEKTSSCGNKLLLTGGGRCNILNLKSAAELKSCYHGKGNFLYPALAGFPPSEAYVFLEKELGLKLAEEENNRIFPASFRSRDVVDALTRDIGQDNIRLNFEVSSAELRPDGIWEVKSSAGDSLRFRNILLAAGGMSYPNTGSTGDSYRIASAAGHSLTETRAALAPVKTEERSRISVPAGLTLKDCRLKLVDGDKVIRETTGDMLFTHDGLSGPAVMELARDIKKGQVLKADLAPGLTDRILLDQMDGHPAKRFVNVLAQYIPLSFAEYALAASEADPGICCQAVNKTLRKAVLAVLKDFKITAAADPDIRTAYVTAGGVDTDEVVRKTMESKIAKGLFLAGEVLDCDGISGGYNLTACIAQAKLAVDSLRIV